MKKFFAYMLMAVMAVAFAACSKDDEPGKNTTDGVSDYINALQMLYYSDGELEGEPRFTPTDTEGIYVAVAKTQDDCYAWVSRLIGSKWDGKSTTVAFDEKSKVQIIGTADENEGIYAGLIVNFPGYTPFTLQIVTPEKAANSDNGYGGDITFLH